MNYSYRLMTKVIKDEPDITILSTTIISVKEENIEHAIKADNYFE